MVMVALMVSACNKEKPEAPIAKDAASTRQSDRLFSPESLIRGASLFQGHCARCHGPEAQGHPDWQNPQVVAAPPLNGTGNDWKRRKQDMIVVIKNGAKRGGIPVMPGWDGRLSENDIDAIINWYQALWPPDVYDRWFKANAPTASPKG